MRLYITFCKLHTERQEQKKHRLFHLNILHQAQLKNTESISKLARQTHLWPVYQQLTSLSSASLHVQALPHLDVWTLLQNQHRGNTARTFSQFFLLARPLDRLCQFIGQSFIKSVSLPSCQTVHYFISSSFSVVMLLLLPLTISNASNFTLSLSEHALN